jgi:hypothetical protein
MQDQELALQEAIKLRAASAFRRNRFVSQLGRRLLLSLAPVREYEED